MNLIMHRSTRMSTVRCDNIMCITYFISSYQSLDNVSVSFSDVVDLEEMLRNAIVYGHPITYRPYNKILIVIEGNIKAINHYSNNDRYLFDGGYDITIAGHDSTKEKIWRISISRRSS